MHHAMKNFSSDYQKRQIIALGNVREISRMLLISRSNINDVLCAADMHGRKKKSRQPNIFLRDQRKLCAELKKA